MNGNVTRSVPNVPIIIQLLDRVDLRSEGTGVQCGNYCQINASFSSNEAAEQ